MAFGDGWTIEAKCPHGDKFRVPLDTLRRPSAILDPCAEARAERDAEREVEALRRGRVREWRDRMRFRLFLNRGADAWRSEK